MTTHRADPTLDELLRDTCALLRQRGQGIDPTDEQIKDALLAASLRNMLSPVNRSRRNKVYWAAGIVASGQNTVYQLVRGLLAKQN